MESPNGVYLEGSWKEGKKHGFGASRNIDGSEYWGFWENDEPHGEGWKQFPYGTGFGLEYEHGKVIKRYDTNQ